MKRITAMLLALCLLCVGCGVPSEGGFTEGVYDTQTDSTVFMPRITFDLTDHRFTFMYDALSSYLSVGTFTVTAGHIAATTDDGLYTYCFDVVDKDSIRFAQKGSSLVEAADGETLLTLADGAVFHRRGAK